MIHRAALVAALCAPLCSISAQGAARTDSSNVVETTGVGVVRLPPDYGIITVSIGVRDSSPAAAAVRNGALLRVLLDSLNRTRLPAESITVAGISVRPLEDRGRAVIVGYDSSAEIRIVFRNLDRVGAILDIAFRSGATGIRDIAYRSDREEAARRDALSLAYGSAIADARAIAAAAGHELGALVRVSTSCQSNFISLAESTGWETVSVVPREIRVNARVSATYRMGPRTR